MDYNFFTSLGHHWVALMSGIASIFMSFREKVFNGTIGRKFFLSVGIICLFFAFYFSWDEQHQRALNAESKAKIDEWVLNIKQERINDLQTQIIAKNNPASNGPMSSLRIEGSNSGNAANMIGSPGAVIHQEINQGPKPFILTTQVVSLNVETNSGNLERPSF